MTVIATPRVARTTDGKPSRYILQYQSKGDTYNTQPTRMISHQSIIPRQIYLNGTCFILFLLKSEMKMKHFEIDVNFLVFFSLQKNCKQNQLRIRSYKCESERSRDFQFRIYLQLICNCSSTNEVISIRIPCIIHYGI